MSTTPEGGAAPDAAVDDAPPAHPEADVAFAGKTSNKGSRSKTTTAVNKQPVERSASAASSVTSDDNNNNTSSSWKARNSFTADSPYFNAFCEAEVKQLHVLSESLREIANRTQTLTKTGIIMSEAAQRLSASCKFQSLQLPIPEEETAEEKEERLAILRQNRQMRRQAVGDEMASFLEVLGDVSVCSFLFCLVSQCCDFTYFSSTMQYTHTDVG